MAVRCLSLSLLQCLFLHRAARVEGRRGVGEQPSSSPSMPSNSRQEGAGPSCVKARRTDVMEPTNSTDRVEINLFTSSPL